MNKKVEDLVDYLDSMGMSQNSYLVMADWQELHHSYDMLTYCKKIYELFRYIGLTNDQIEMFIINNKKIFIAPFNEIVKMAYVLKKVDMHDEMFKAQRSSSNASQYKKIFMRHLLYEKSNKYADGCGIYGLIERSRKAYDQYSLSLMARDVFHKTIISDDDLEVQLNKIILFNNEHVTVDEFIDKASKLFYMEYIRKSRKDRRK